MSEWFQPKNDPEVQEAAREFPCDTRHGSELPASHDQPEQRAQGGEMLYSCHYILCIGFDGTPQMY